MSTPSSKSTIPVSWIVLSQTLTTLIGFVLLFGWCTKQVLRFQLSKIEDVQLLELQQKQQGLYNFQSEFDQETFENLLSTICIELNCVWEDVAIQRSRHEKIEHERLKVTLEIDLLNIPILLDVLRGDPMGWSVQGVEVHAYKRPSKMQVRLYRSILPTTVDTPKWIIGLGWSDTEIETVNALYQSWLARHWSEIRGEELQESKVLWQHLFTTLHRDLWSIHLHKGSLVFTPKEGIELTYIED